MSCCDGTGWTGNPHAPCPEHYVSNADLLEMARLNTDTDDDGGPLVTSLFGIPITPSPAIVEVPTPEVLAEREARS